ncbi:MAG TPA: phytoene desaturase family protein [Isosphaeraceae bacterium]|nr:phytoene desaturase family protein [Isosphaeraceae bacterium]
MSTNRSATVGVIGGGLGGLAAACTLAARGYSVVLLEKNPWLGGKAALWEEQGFRFDMGPTILTLPSVLARIFDEAGRRLDDYLELVRIDPQWRSFFTDGTTLDLMADIDQMSAGLEAYARGTGPSYRRFMEHSARLHRISDRFFFWRPVGGLRDMFDIKTAFEPSLLPELLAMRPGSSVAATVRSHVPDARVAQMLDHFTQYVGSAPDASPAVLCGIAHMQTSEGVWYPLGGTGAVPRALTRLATELGVEIRTGTGVRRILLTEDGGVRGVETETGECIPLDAVVSNADAVRTHRELLGGKAATRFERRRRYEPACSGVVLYLGLDRRYDHLLHHNFVFSHDPEEEFESIYRRGEPAPDPTCYVCAPARTEPDVAPPGGEALYVLVHTPYLRPHHVWDRLFPRYRKTILEKLSSTGGLTDIADRVRVERWLTPADIHQRYGVLNGAIYGIASHGRWLGAFKPSNRSPDVKGLYLAGGAAHPGPGMPMVLMSGWIAADALDCDGVASRAVSGKTLSAVDVPCLPSQEIGSRTPLAGTGTPADSSPPVLARRSPLLVRFFIRHVKRFYLARNFHAVRLSRSGRLGPLPAGPLIVVLNHPSWWDPLVGMVLTELFPNRAHFAPMEADALRRYRIFDRMGMFGVERETRRGAREFLRTSCAILARAGTALWITAQGRFADARERPPGVQPGVAHLARRLKQAVILPVALEYPFWEERYPEALARFGQAIVVERGADRSVEKWRTCIEGALASTQDALACEAQRRDPAAFETLVGGKAGVGGIYECWQWFRRRRLGTHFRAEHGVTGVLPAPGGPS